MEIYIKDITGVTLSLKVERNFTIYNIKKKISKLISVPVNEQRLMKRDEVLKDDKTVDECDIHKESIIFLYSKKSSEKSGLLVENKIIDNKKIVGFKKLRIKRRLLKEIKIVNSENFVPLFMKPRIGLNNRFSSGNFIDLNGKEWIGKCEYLAETVYNRNPSLGKISSSSLREKISYDIYEYYGAFVPSNCLSPQPMMNVGECFLKEKKNVEKIQLKPIHIMSMKIKGFKDYCNKPNFDPQNPKFDGFITFEGKKYEEVGLGKILAVALFINDLDVVGGSNKSSNVGYVLTKNENGCEIAKIYKIDPGYSLSYHVNKDGVQQHLKIENKKIKTSVMGKEKLDFKFLPEKTKKEFLLTLHEIINTEQMVLESFFKREGCDDFILYDNWKVDSLTETLVLHQEELKRVYKEELELNQTENEYQVLRENSSHPQKLKNWEYKHFGNYILKDKYNKELNLATEVKKFLLGNEKKLMLLEGDSGFGKTLSLLFLKNKILDFKKKNIKFPKPFFLRINEFVYQNKDQIKNCIILGIYKKYKVCLKQELNCVILLNGYDEVLTSFQINLYQSNLLYLLPKVKVIISCRSQYLDDDKNLFYPKNDQDVFQPNQFVEYKIMRFNETKIDFCELEKEFNIKYSELKFNIPLKLVGVGRYGKVYRGIWDEKEKKDDVDTKEEKDSTEKVTEEKDCEIDVAIKEHTIFSSEKVEILKEIIKKSKNLTELSHDNIVKFYGFCKNNSNVYIITKYINGGNLGELLFSKKIKLTLKEKLNIALDVARGINYLHGENIVNRDINLKTILILKEKNEFYQKNNYRAKIFVVGNTRKKSGCFIPPENLKLEDKNQKSNINERKIDIYAFGVVLWCLFNERYPNEKEVPIETFPKINHSMTKSFVRIMEKCYDVDPQKRPLIKDIINEIEILVENCQLEGDEKVRKKKKNNSDKKQNQLKNLQREFLKEKSQMKKKFLKEKKRVLQMEERIMKVFKNFFLHQRNVRFTSFKHYKILEKISSNGVNSFIYKVELGGNFYVMKILKIPKSVSNYSFISQKSFQIYGIISNENNFPPHENVISIFHSFKEELTDKKLKSLEKVDQKKFYPNSTPLLCRNTGFLIMEYFEMNLQHLIKSRDHKFSEKEFLSILCNLLEGANHFHYYKYVHRDIKPENIFVQVRYYVELMQLEKSDVLDLSKLKEETIITLFKIGYGVDVISIEGKYDNILKIRCKTNADKIKLLKHNVIIISNNQFKVLQVNEHSYRCVIGDFGCSLFCETGFDNQVGSKISGNPYSFPKEIFTALSCNQPIDYSKCDIFAIGLCCYQVISKEDPFGGVSSDKREQNDYREIENDFSKETRDVIRRMCFIDQKERLTIKNAKDIVKKILWNYSH